MVKLDIYLQFTSKKKSTSKKGKIQISKESLKIITVRTRFLGPRNILQKQLNFVTCTEHHPIWTNIGNLENAPYYKSNETYDVTNHVFGGSGYEIWKNLQSDLNFTSNLYKRKEKKYGVPIESENGSLQISDGYVNDVYRGKADIFARQFTIMYDRHLFIDFLQPIEKSKVGIFVKRNDLVEGFDIEVRVASIVAHHDELLTQWRYI